MSSLSVSRVGISHQANAKLSYLIMNMIFVNVWLTNLVVLVCVRLLLK